MLINFPKQEADCNLQLFLISTGLGQAGHGTFSDISEKVPTRRRRKWDKLRIIIQEKINDNAGSKALGYIPRASVL